MVSKNALHVEADEVLFSELEILSFYIYYYWTQYLV